MSRMLSVLLPKLYHFRTSWDNAPSTSKNMKSLIEKLQLEEDRVNQHEQSSEFNN